MGSGPGCGVSASCREGWGGWSSPRGRAPVWGSGHWPRGQLARRPGSPGWARGRAGCVSGAELRGRREARRVTRVATGYK